MFAFSPSRLWGKKNEIKGVQMTFCMYEGGDGLNIGLFTVRTMAEAI